MSCAQPSRGNRHRRRGAATRPRCARSCPTGRRSPPTRPSPTRSTSTGCCCRRSRPTARATSAASWCGTAARWSACSRCALERRFHGLPLRALRSWRHRNMLLWGTPLVRAKSAAKCIAALLESGLAPVIEFDWVSAGGAVLRRAGRSRAGGGVPWAVTDAYTRAVLLRERDPRARFNSNMKNNLRRWQARLAAHGEVTPVRLAAGRRPRARGPRSSCASRRAAGRAAPAARSPAARTTGASSPQVFAEAFRRGRLRDHRPRPRRPAARAPLHADRRARAPSPTRSRTTRPTRNARPASSARSTTCASSWRRRGRAGSTRTPRARTPATAACGRTASRCSASPSALRGAGPARGGRAAAAAARRALALAPRRAASGCSDARVGDRSQYATQSPRRAPSGLDRRFHSRAAASVRCSALHDRRDPSAAFPAVARLSAPHGAGRRVRPARPRAVRAPQLPEPHHDPHERRGALAHRAGDAALAEGAHRRQAGRQPPRGRASGGRTATSRRCATRTARPPFFGALRAALQAAVRDALRAAGRSQPGRARAAARRVRHPHAARAQLRARGRGRARPT